jgi:hypothetical protein
MYFKIKNLLLEGGWDLKYFVPSFLLFIPFFISRITWGLDNESKSLYLHIPQAIIFAAICAIGLLQFKVYFRQAIVFVIFTGLLFIHFIHAALLYGNLLDYNRDYFSQGILLWAYLFSVCFYASTIKLNDYKNIMYFFNIFSISFTLISIIFYVLYKWSGVGLLIHFYEGFELARLQGFFSEPSAFAPISCWLLLYGIRYKKIINIGLAIVICVLTYSPIVLISTFLALISYVIIFHPRIIPLIFLLGFLTVVWVNLVDCLATEDVTSLTRAACGAKSIFDVDTRAIFSNDRLLSSFVIFEHLKATSTWVYGQGINSTSIFMPAHYGAMRDNSLPISIVAFYGVIGALVLVVSVATGLIVAWRRKNIYSIFWLSFFWCSMINSAQGFITYTLLFVASIWLLSFRNQQTSHLN